MVLQMREVVKPPTPEVSPRHCLPTLPPPKNIPPDIAALMSQFDIPDRSKDSPFIERLLNWLNHFEPYFEERPYFYQTEWQGLKVNLQKIKEAIGLARSTSNDLPLYLCCLEIQKISLPFWARWQNWNYLSSLQDLLVEHQKNGLKGLRLQPVIEPDGALLAQKHLELIIHFLIQTREVCNLQNELKASKDYQDLQRRINQLTAELTTSKGARTQLVARNTELQRHIMRLQQANELQQKTIQAHLKRFEELDQEIAKLRIALQEAYEENKNLSDKNEALSLKVQPVEKNSSGSVVNTAIHDSSEALAAMGLKLQEKDNELQAVRRQLARFQYKQSDLQNFYHGARQTRKALKKNLDIARMCSEKRNNLMHESLEGISPKAPH